MLLTWAECKAAMSQIVREAIPRDRPLEVLEAGCGRTWSLNVPEDRLRITGVDLDPDALAARTDLVEAIHGDLTNKGLLKDRTYDLVYSQFVVEHIPAAEDAMRAMVSWTRPGGTLIVIVPDSRSVHGWAADNTPHVVHVLAHRYIFGNPDAGKPGHAPYPIQYSSLTTQSGLERFAAAHSLHIDAKHLICGMPNKHRTLVDAGKRTVAWASRQRLAWQHDNLAYVFRREVP